MEPRNAYNIWAESYDSAENKTRDLEGKAIREVLSELKFNHILEAGCGTGKNSIFLSEKCNMLTSVDFSPEMISIARKKVQKANVQFSECDLTKEWTFTGFDLICCSLVLEHVSDLDHIFSQANGALNDE